jgi:hypothetical protein
MTTWRALCALTTRQSILAGRDRGLRVALAIFLAVLCAFFAFDYLDHLERPAGSEAPARELGADLLRHQWLLSAAFAPWLAQRIRGRDRRDRLVRSAVTFGAAPWQPIVARLGVAWMVVVGTVAAALPPLWVATLVSEVTAGALVAAQMELLLFLLVAVAVLFHVFSLALDELTSLALAYVVFAALAAARLLAAQLLAPVQLRVLTLVALPALLALLVASARRRFAYL